MALTARTLQLRNSLPCRSLRASSLVVRANRPILPGCTWTGWVRTFSSSHNKDHAATTTTTTPVAIIGGGPAGLLLSNFLSLYQVPSILLEDQSVDQRCSHPQAHFLNTRTMEILRHLPRIHNQVQEQMTPVEQWKHFQFGYNMQPSTNLARVLHPVDRPLQANRNANGILVQDDHNRHPTTNREELQRNLSPCTVGHLAQHTFCRILYDAAMEQALKPKHSNHYNNENDCDLHTQVLYNTRVTKIDESSSSTSTNQNIGSDGFIIHTEATDSHHETPPTTRMIQSKVCIAADGAHSFCRNHWKMDQVGHVGIQHLLNIHVKTCPEWAREQLHDSNRNFAMLYSVFHPNIVAMIVCHSVGEYVFQVPFFPPYQSLEDYSQERVQQMVVDAMGISSDDHANQPMVHAAKLEIVSVKAWTMSSLLADKYYHDSGTGTGIGYLVGDAAHVFPPGMFSTMACFFIMDAALFN